MLHSLLCCNDDGYVLLARYFQTATPLSMRAAFETQLVHACKLVPQLSERLKKEPGDQLVMCDDKYVVLRQVGELRWYLTGSGEYDELILTDVLNVWSAVLSQQLEKRFTEASLLANYAKVVVALDEMVQQGHMENMDDSSIEQMAKLRPYPTK